MHDNVSIEFTVEGTPATQGSKQARPAVYRTGRAAGLPVRRHKGSCPGRTMHGPYIGRDGRELCRCPIIVNTVEDDKRLNAWRETVAWHARAAYQGEVLDGTLVASFEFVIPRPKAHYGTGRNERILKPSAPAAPGKRPDCLKLARAIEDALAKVVYADDSLIVSEFISKRYCARWEPQRVHVKIRPTVAQTVGDLVELGLLELAGVEEDFEQLDLLTAA